MSTVTIAGAILALCGFWRSGCGVAAATLIICADMLLSFWCPDLTAQSRILVSALLLFPALVGYLSTVFIIPLCKGALPRTSTLLFSTVFAFSLLLENSWYLLLKKDLLAQIAVGELLIGVLALSNVAVLAAAMCASCLGFGVMLFELPLRFIIGLRERDFRTIFDAVRPLMIISVCSAALDLFLGLVGRELSLINLIAFRGALLSHGG